MLRLFRDSVTVAMYPDRVLLARVRRGRSPQVTARHAEPADGSGPEAAVAALESALAQPQWRDTRATVLVSNALVRYCMVPASEQVVGLAEEAALAQHRVRQTHGAGSSDWALRMAGPLLDGDQPAAALDAVLLERITGALAGARMRVAGVRPFFMHAYNRCRDRMAGGEFWFANAEPGALALARISGGRWQGLGVQAISGDLGSCLARCLREGEMMSSAAKGAAAVYLYAPGMACPRDATVAGMPLADLTDAPAGSAADALAAVLGT